CSLYIQPDHLIHTLVPYTTLFRSKSTARGNLTLDAENLPTVLLVLRYDVKLPDVADGPKTGGMMTMDELRFDLQLFADDGGDNPDRKSTRLNSSHVKISYAVICLK